jgi:hypothetical protein
MDGPNIVLLALPGANYRHFHFHTAVRPSSNSSTSLGVGAQPVIGRTARERRHGAAFDDTDNQLGVALWPPRGVRRRGHQGSPRRNGNPRPTTGPTVNAIYRLNPATRPPSTPSLITDEPSTN